MNIRRSLVCVLLTACACASFAAGPIVMKLSPVLEGYTPSGGSVPVHVDLRNDGPAAKGVLRVTANEFQMDYPVELPRGARKRLTTYPSASWGGIRFVLSTDQGRLIQDFELQSDYSDGRVSVALVTDTPGEMSFLKSKANPNNPTNQNIGFQDCYIRPEFAPDRPVGLAGVQTVVLGGGSERLTDAQVQAIKIWALSGGTLLFIGGASAPTLSDPRWGELLPIREGEVRTVAGSPLLQKIGNAPISEMSIVVGKPTEGAQVVKDGPTPMVIERPLGLGKVVFFAFNPFEEPMNQWEGKRAVFTRYLRAAEAQRTRTFLKSYTSEGSVQEEYTSYGTATPTTTGGSGFPPPGTPSATTFSPSAPPVSELNDPFSMKLPPTEKVFGLLGVYFLAVVPLNFLVLRKFRKGEFAWFTAPVLALGFAGLLFASSQSLYQAKMASATQGLLIGQDGLAEGIFVGNSQVFVPRSGVYDLGLKNVDSLGVSDPQDDYYSVYQGSETTEFDPVDTGQIEVPRMRANNLAFKRLVYRQRIPVGEWFSLDVAKGAAKGSFRLTAKNSSPHDLKRSIIYTSTGKVEIGDLPAGESKTVDVKVNPNAQGLTDIQEFLKRHRQAVLTGNLAGLRPGPQLGAVVEGRSAVRLAFFSNGNLKEDTN